MENTGKKQNIAVALSMFAASGILFVLALRLDDSTHLGMTGTRLVPVIATTAMLVFSAARCVMALVQRGGEVSPRDKSNSLRWFVVIVLLILYAVFLEVIGYFVATFILLLIVAPLFGLKNPAVVFGLSLITTTATWLLFTKAFGGYLPTALF